MTDQERKDAIRFFEWVAEDEAMNYSRLAIEALKAQELKNVPDTNVGDMISRYTGIDACLKGKMDGLPATNVACDYCAERIRVLPSVQPDIIVCADCKHWVCHDRRCGYWNHGVKPLEWCCHGERRTDG